VQRPDAAFSGFSFLSFWFVLIRGSFLV